MNDIAPFSASGPSSIADGTPGARARSAGKLTTFHNVH